MQNKTIILAAGCFWCYQPIFEMLNGVIAVEVGYSGGNTPNPDYHTISTGNTGHAEAIKVTYNPTQISLGEILEVFWAVHDPTTLNRQGNDVGTQYRSAIFYETELDRKIALESKQQAQSAFEDPIVTEITAYTDFYPAEDYHQNYYQDNSYQPYCQVIISPKISKFKQKFAAKVQPRQ